MNARIKFFLSNKFIILSFKFVKTVIGPLHLGENFDWNFDENECQYIDEIAVSCSAIVVDEFELELTKTDDKARIWMTMFQSWSTKDEIETSNRTFQSVRDEIENTFSDIKWRGDENGRENI